MAAPEHAVGDTIEVWRYADDVIDCKVTQELGRGAQAIVYRVVSEGVACALKVASVLPVADEARALLASTRGGIQYSASALCVLARQWRRRAFISAGADRRRSGRAHCKRRFVRQTTPCRATQRQCCSTVSAVCLCNCSRRWRTCTLAACCTRMSSPTISWSTLTWQLHLIDFGIATVAGERQYDRRGRVKAQMHGGTAAFISPLQSELMRDARGTRDTTERRELLLLQLLTQHADIWGAAATCLEMFSGGGRWRSERRSADAWRDMGHSLARLQPGAMRVALPALVRHRAMFRQHDAASRACAQARHVPMRGNCLRLRCCDRFEGCSGACRRHARNVALALHKRRAQLKPRRATATR